jgi:hypothetical protein
MRRLAARAIPRRLANQCSQSPALIDHGPKYYQPPPDSELKYPVWLNLVRLAKDLAIVETTPALAKWIGVTTSSITTLTTETHLENSPAGQALIQIGDPSNYKNFSLTVSPPNGGTRHMRYG